MAGRIDDGPVQRQCRAGEVGLAWNLAAEGLVDFYSLFSQFIETGAGAGCRDGVSDEDGMVERLGPEEVF